MAVESPLLDKIINILSNNFERIIYFDIALFIFLFLLFFAVKFRDIDFRAILRSVLTSVFIFIVIGGQVFLLIVSAYTVWANYQKPEKILSMHDVVYPTTEWIKNDIIIYYIDGKALFSVKLNGEELKKIFQSDEKIKEYHFSPDGQAMLINTTHTLYLYKRNLEEAEIIDSVVNIEAGRGYAGVLNGIRWAPDSRKFCYELSRWSRFSTQENLYVYDLSSGKKSAIQSPSRKISSLYWDASSENLYYLQHKSLDPQVHQYPFEVKVFRIPLETLTPELVTRIPYDKSTLPLENLELRDIKLFTKGREIAFGREGSKEQWQSELGSFVGIDKKDYMYYVKNKWFRKRLFKIPREPVYDVNPKYQYKGGELTVSQIRWIPGGKYVIMRDRFLGILVLDPEKKRIGQLLEAHGDTFGWYFNIFS